MKNPSIPNELPLMPLKDVVVFPHMIVPLQVGRSSSMQAVDNALGSGSRLLFFVAQKSLTTEEPTPADIYDMGTVGQILRMIKLPDGKMKVLVQGIKRAKLLEMSRREENGFFMARIETLEEEKVADEYVAEAQMRTVKEQLLRLAGLGKAAVVPDFIDMLSHISEPSRLADLLSGNIASSVADSQALLETLDPLARLKKISEFFARELSILEVQQQIAESAKGEIDKNQREYYLREQLKAIQKELGERESLSSEIEELRAKIREAKMPPQCEEEALKQLKRLSTMTHDSAEGSVIRSYLELLAELPWSNSSEESLSIYKAKKILDEDHYGMTEVKERILDFLAIRKLKKDLKSPILCLVGPPGVGKTSLGMSVARSLDRKFVRMSFGGMRDEAEIRGHRRTYIGALPGKIIQGLKTAGVKNPVMMLDEIDKLGSDFRGDPASALLEVLDPVQNVSFTDHYLGLPFDLSQVLFITTANYLDPIPAPLRDRMEIIKLAGYTEEEKLVIAKRYIIPRQIEETGLTKKMLSVSPEAVREIISGYTREAGLRRLEQLVGTACRKVGRQVVEKKGKRERYYITKQSVSKYLGTRLFQNEEELEGNEVGIATGLAWTPAGGETLFVECVRYKGKGGFKQTGMVGDVMKESMQAAFTYVRSIAAEYGVDERDFTKYDIHIHIPAGAIPKDGPSAGITMASAILSVFSGRPVKKDVAMTGEITITGKVLPIGGLKEKLYAAKRLGVNTVIIPKKNERELSEFPKNLLAKLTIVPVSLFKEVIDRVLI